MRKAIVTGASTGIGRTVAVELSKNGFSVFLVARNQRALEETKEIIAKGNANAYVLQADLGTVDGINKLISDISKLNIHIDLLANIAGIWHGEKDVYAGKELQSFDQKIILDTFNVGTIAPMLLVHGLLAQMGARSKIINLSGTFENGAKGWLPYYVSKRALEDLTIGLSQELEDRDIQVNCISPSDTATESYSKFFPQYMDDAIDPIEIAKKFVELSDPLNSTTGKVFVIKKGTEPQDLFHF